MKLKTLYMVVGEEDMQGVIKLAHTAFPSKMTSLAPLLDQHDAEQIASERYTKNDQYGYTGHILTFEIDEVYLKKYLLPAPQGELFVPAHELDEFNKHIVGPISIKSSYYGKAS